MMTRPTNSPKFFFITTRSRTISAHSAVRLAAILVRVGTAEMWWAAGGEVGGADAVVAISRAGPFR